MKIFATKAQRHQGFTYNKTFCAPSCLRVLVAIFIVVVDDRVDVIGKGEDVAGIGRRPEDENDIAHELKRQKRVEVLVDVGRVGDDEEAGDEEELLARVYEYGPGNERNGVVDPQHGQELGFEDLQIMVCRDVHDDGQKCHQQAERDPVFRGQENR